MPRRRWRRTRRVETLHGDDEHGKFCGLVPGLCPVEDQRWAAALARHTAWKHGEAAADRNWRRDFPDPDVPDWREIPDPVGCSENEEGEDEQSPDVPPRHEPDSSNGGDR